MSSELFAKRTDRMNVSALRELLKVTKDPNIISFAGGLPANEALPVTLLHDLYLSVTEQYGPSVFQYGPTEAMSEFVTALVAFGSDMGLISKPENIVVGTGSQAILDSLGKILLDPGDGVAVETPTYLGALQAFNPYEPKYFEIPCDESGIIPEGLEQILAKHHIKFVYTVPTFQNPTGKTIPLNRRLQIAKLVENYGVFLVEDDPYSHLRYTGQAVPSFQSMIPELVVYTSTFSKILCPDLRLGFAVAPEAIVEKLLIAKQGVDLCTSRMNQLIATKYLNDGHFEPNMQYVRSLYAPRAIAMLTALEKYFPEESVWTNPEGGMFTWVTLPEGIDALDLFRLAVKESVAFVPGIYFFANQGQKETMRLNFTNQSEERIHDGIGKLAKAVKKLN